MYHILSTGSKGNAVIYHNTILVDCGVSYKSLSPFIQDLQLVLLTHKHTDHLKKSTLKKIALERPSIRFGCGTFLLEHLPTLTNIDTYQAGKIYDYGSFQISPIMLYHDVPNFGYRIFGQNAKILHATDTYTLEGISAKGYDLYAIEANYDEERVWDVIKQKQAAGKYAHQLGSINSHLSMQQAQQFILDNATSNYEFVALHQSSEY